MMNVHFLLEAEDEVRKASDHYDDQKPGLGDEFAEEVRNTIQRIVKVPQAWIKLTDNVRKCNTKRFPYAVVYAQRGDDIYILAIMHQRREPFYWIDRLSDLPDEA